MRSSSTGASAGAAVAICSTWVTTRPPWEEVENARVPMSFILLSYTAPMTHLRDRTSVECPAAETQSRLEVYFASLRAADGVARLRLRVPMISSANVLGVSLVRDVRVEAHRARDELNLN